MDHGNRQPLGTLRRLDSISILPLVLLELHTVQKNEMVSLVHLLKYLSQGMNCGWRMDTIIETTALG